MTESRYIMYSILAGIIAGIITGIVLFIKMSNVFNDFIYELTFHQLVSGGLSEEEATYIARTTTLRLAGLMNWLLLIGPIINMLLLGALLGVLLDILIKKVNLRPWLASIVVGLIFITLLRLLPLYLIGKFYDKWLINTMFKYIGLHLILMPSIIYTIMLVLFNTIKGPWTRVAEAKPEIY